MDKAQAEKHLKAAQKAAKSGFLKKPDWDVAATEFEKAAQAYDSLKLWSDALTVWGDTCNAHYKAKNYYYAARAQEAMSKIHQDSGAMEQAADCLEKASSIYIEDEKPDKQADALMRAAKLLITKATEKSIELLNSAIAIYEDNKRWHLCGEAFRTLTNVYLKQERWDDAIANIRRQFPAFKSMEQPHNVHKGYVEIIILQLYKGDTVAAEKALEEAHCFDGRFTAKEEGEAADTLIQAVKSRDPEKLAEVSKKQVFNFLTTDIARMVKKIKILGATADGSTATSSSANKPNSPAGVVAEPPKPNLEDLEPDLT